MLKNANNQGTTILHNLKVDYTLGDFEVNQNIHFLEYFQVLYLVITKLCHNAIQY
ncbi:hypothetical protein HanXRQr2_Chr01g0031481 [Helianthus annuus]|uniref:Uncharacterized protein n=1 Tax=Helianthus annuus TaxID=4232 RepID=A0A9K3P3V4_HELAN|nr:hypothetical protein HanXRQr2_Chr01g0031481 [Helianthus annuus]KAJ0957704.1 hypothetical protein HanPSC8_Chr01g0030751 [Helianthus annuus]